MGGIGKTLSLLSIDYKNPVIYVPLRNILNEERCIENYIKEQTLHSSENDYKLLLEYCELAWDEKQHLILIIDGLNEVDSSLRKLVVRQIEKWSQKKNVQLIITSRNDMSYDMNCGCLWSLKTNFLSKFCLFFNSILFSISTALLQNSSIHFLLKSEDKVERYWVNECFNKLDELKKFNNEYLDSFS